LRAPEYWPIKRTQRRKRLRALSHDKGSTDRQRREREAIIQEFDKDKV
jgi:hypothetical protein